jgi:hypothetical protein
VLKLRAEIAKHSQATVVGSPIFEATSETMVENPFIADLIEIRLGDPSHVRQRVIKELSFIRRFHRKSLILVPNRSLPTCLIEWQRLPVWHDPIRTDLRFEFPFFFSDLPFLLEKLYLQQRL